MVQEMVMQATNQKKHEAGRHLVAAEALIRGYDADTLGRSGLVDVNGHGTEIHVKVVGSVADQQHRQVSDGELWTESCSSI